MAASASLASAAPMPIQATSATFSSNENVILIGDFVRVINPMRHKRRSPRYIYGYRAGTGQGIAGTPYRSGFSDRPFKSSGFGFTLKDPRDGYSDRAFKSDGIGFSDNNARNKGYSSSPFPSSAAARFSKNFFGSRPFRSSGYGFGF
jgi:hypothetical protein